MENKEKNENAPEVKVNKEMIDDFIKEILKETIILSNLLNQSMKIVA